MIDACTVAACGVWRVNGRRLFVVFAQQRTMTTKAMTTTKESDTLSRFRNTFVLLPACSDADDLSCLHWPCGVAAFACLACSLLRCCSVRRGDLT